jgi:HD-like signal output (HDOD) protein
MTTNSSLPLETVLDMAKTIPCSPAILPGLLSLIDKDDVEIHAIERLIRTDAGLTTAVLRLANSAFFGSNRRCESVDEAMLRLGSRTIYKLAATAAAGRWLGHSVQGYGWEPGDLSRHSLVVAIAAEALCALRPVVRPEAAYTAGLIHDVGKLAMAYSNLPALNEVEQRLGEDSQSWRALETEVIGYDFTNVTRVLLQHWSFPKSLISVGALYPQPRLADEEDRPFVTLIHAAKHLALQLGVGVGSDGFYLEVDEAALAAGGFDDALLEEALPQILTKLQPFIGPDGQIQLIR